MRLILLLLFLMPLFSLPALTPANGKIKVLYKSLDPHSISQHLAFYRLYPDSPEGQDALRRALKLMSPGTTELSINEQLPDLISPIEGIVTLINKAPQEQIPILSESELALIEELAKFLPNRNLKGHSAKTEFEVLQLPLKEIDLARGLFLSQFSDDPKSLQKARSYEALIDLMALQILTKLSLDASPEEKIEAMNDLIFNEMGFRFPPHSSYAKDIDLYTFLPSVLDSRRGVCLGVSTLYICLAQRLNLSLEMITPPGHIYVRYHNGDTLINIETTARGIDLESDVYLSVDTRSLEQRNVKEVIGLAHFNQASGCWESGNYEKGLECYRNTAKYVTDDMLLNELMGYSNLLTGHIEEGESLLNMVKNHIPDYAVSKQTMAEDYLNGHIDQEGIKIIFMSVDETRQSLLRKKIALESKLLDYPKFRAGLFTLAGTWLQLHREAEALQVLERYHELYPEDPSAEYYLAAIYAERFDYGKAWKHLEIAEKLTAARNHYPKALKQLRKHLSMLSPN